MFIILVLIVTLVAANERFDSKRYPELQAEYPEDAGDIKANKS
jgi:hypothetical protein